MLCSREQFVEAIFVGNVSPSSVAELRIKQEELLRLSDLAFDDMMGTLAPSDRVELDQFRESMELLESMEFARRIREV
ncbi:hypothetical protein [Sorangium sp. So ce362]|uniref:hypothetical protein n=1 Tax=Sorangium sp. So ce362 TaxID=3133303 RepID=UPI003F64032E